MRENTGSMRAMHYLEDKTNIIEELKILGHEVRNNKFIISANRRANQSLI